MSAGGCACGAVRFETQGAPIFRTICHCRDCRRQSGAPFLAWAMFRADAIATRGEPSVYASSASGRRAFCGACGTGLFFRNAALEAMGMTQVRIAAFDDPDALPPLAQVQTAERLGWTETAHELPGFARFPQPGGTS